MFAPFRFLYARTLQAAAATAHERWFVRTHGASLGAIHALVCDGERLALDELIAQLESALAELQHTCRASSSAPLPMSDVSPRLAELRNTSLLRPGTLSGDAAVSTIVALAPALVVLRTKTKPKLVGLLTADGREHRLLLKGGEDLRVDERVSQVLQFCASLCTSLGADVIRHYNVTPIGLRAGLIQVVDHVVPLYDLYTAWRARANADIAPVASAVSPDSKGSSAKAAKGGKRSPVAADASGAAVSKAAGPVDDFYRALHRMLVADARDAATRQRLVALEPRQLADCRQEWIQRTDVLVAVFRELSAATPSDLLSRELWVGAASARDWCSRTRTFCLSLAAGSMIGYVLGLGDRHLDNLLVDLSSGSLLHM